MLDLEKVWRLENTVPLIDCSVVILADHHQLVFPRVIANVVPVANPVPMSNTMFAAAVAVAIVPFTGPVAFHGFVHDVCE